MATIANCARCGKLVTGDVFTSHCDRCQKIVDLFRWLEQLHRELVAFASAPQDEAARRRLEEWLASASTAVRFNNKLAASLADDIAAVQAIDELERVMAQVIVE